MAQKATDEGSVLSAMLKAQEVGAEFIRILCNCEPRTSTTALHVVWLRPSVLPMAASYAEQESCDAPYSMSLQEIILTEHKDLAEIMKEADELLSKIATASKAIADVATETSDVEVSPEPATTGAISSL